MSFNMCNIYTKVLRTRLLRKYDNFYRCIVYFFYNFFLVKSIIAELLWKNTLVGAALEDQYVKSEVYKPNCKSCQIYQLNLQKKRFLCKWIWGNKLSLPSFCNETSFPPNFRACYNPTLKKCNLCLNEMSAIIDDPDKLTELKVRSNLPMPPPKQV